VFRRSSSVKRLRTDGQHKFNAIQAHDSGEATQALMGVCFDKILQKALENTEAASDVDTPLARGLYAPQ
jgi:hypothetical protein